jgi:hypothetical protein
VDLHQDNLLSLELLAAAQLKQPMLRHYSILSAHAELAVVVAMSDSMLAAEPDDKFYDRSKEHQ